MKTKNIIITIGYLASFALGYAFHSFPFKSSKESIEIPATSKTVGATTTYSFRKSYTSYKLVPRQPCFLVNDSPRVETDENGQRYIAIDCDNNFKP